MSDAIPVWRDTARTAAASLVSLSSMYTGIGRVEAKGDFPGSS